MLSRIEGHSHTDIASASRTNKSQESSELFSVSLNRETLTALVDGMKKLGLDTGRLHISDGQGRQVSANSSGSRQFFASPVLPSVITTPPGLQPPTASSVSSPAATTSDSPFIPEFQQDVQVVGTFGSTTPLNPIYFATRETAEWIASKYGTGEVVEAPYGGEGGPFTASAKELHIKLDNGRLVNAGWLANYYRRMPEAHFPGMADQYAREFLATLT